MSSPGLFRFGVFEVDFETGELRQQGRKIGVQEKPLQVLAALLERPGEVVTRTELRDRLWPDEFVDFEHSLNAAVKKLRDALGDSATNPRFVETLPKRGYRFIAPVEPCSRETAAEKASAPQPGESQIGVRSWAAIGGILVLFLATIGYFTRERWLPEDGERDPAMLVVLPLSDLSQDADQEYFSDGLTEEIITQLARIDPQKLGVIARTSSMAYKNSEKTVDQIGRELDVDYVLEGSVRREHDTLRIVAQLIEVRNQAHLWVETYERDLGGVLQIQREVSERIADSLALELLPAGKATGLPSAIAHDAYLRGRHVWNQRTAEGLQKAVEFFNLAIEDSTDYAAPHVGLADTYGLFGFYGIGGPTEFIPLAKAAAERALALEPDLAEAHVALGWSRFVYDWDWEGAQEAFEVGFRLNPSYATGREWYGAFLVATGEADRGIAETRRALRLDPLSRMINAGQSWNLFYAHRFEDAIAAAHHALGLDPNFAPAHNYLGKSYAATGQYERAIAALERANELSERDPMHLAELGYTVARAGDRSRAEQVIATLQTLSEEMYVSPYRTALIYVGLGETDQAFGWLERAYADRSYLLAYMGVDPRLEPISSDPRYVSLLRRTGHHYLP